MKKPRKAPKKSAPMKSGLTAMPPRQVSSAPDKAPPMDVMPKDMAKDRNFTKQGKPKLNASSAGGGSGQRR